MGPLALVMLACRKWEAGVGIKETEFNEHFPEFSDQEAADFYAANGEAVSANGRRCPGGSPGYSEGTIGANCPERFCCSGSLPVAGRERFWSRSIAWRSKGKSPHLASSCAIRFRSHVVNSALGSSVSFPIARAPSNSN